LFYEKTVDSLSGLMQEVELLDLDGGIRSHVTYNGKKSLVFITRSPGGFTLMVYGRRLDGSQEAPARRLLVKEFRTGSELKRFVGGILTRPVKAFVY
jgi:hypothetical protein